MVACGVHKQGWGWQCQWSAQVWCGCAVLARTHACKRAGTLVRASRHTHSTSPLPRHPPLPLDATAAPGPADAGGAVTDASTIPLRDFLPMVATPVGGWCCWSCPLACCCCSCCQGAVCPVARRLVAALLPRPAGWIPNSSCRGSSSIAGVMRYGMTRSKGWLSVF